MMYLKISCIVCTNPSKKQMVVLTLGLSAFIIIIEKTESKDSVFNYISVFPCSSMSAIRLQANPSP